METIKLNYNLKFKTTSEERERLNLLMDRWGEVMLHVFNHIGRIYFSYVPVSLPKTAKCGFCQEEMALKWQHNTSKQFICNRCFCILWSFQTLTKKEYLDELRKNYPELAVHSGYYNGAVKYAVQQFKSWISKVKDREYEIGRLKTEIQSETNIIKQKKLLSRLKFKEKGIKEYNFKNNVIYLGSASMFELKKEDNKYWIGLADTKELRHRIWYELDLGRAKRYSSNTNHNKFDMVEKSIDTKEFQPLMGKILRNKTEKGYEYSFMYPHPMESRSITTRAEIEKLYKENKDIPLLSLSFGIKKPIIMEVFQSGKSIEKRVFGDGSLWHWINHERNYRAKMAKVFAKKYLGKWKRHKAKQKFFSKRRGKEMDYINYYTHLRTTEFVRYITEKYKNGIIICRDMKGTKKINYPNMYRTVLDRWNIAFQQTFLEYKEMLANFHIYKIPYNQSNNIKCSKCMKDIKQDDKQTKALTYTLNEGLSRESYLKQKYNSIQRKMYALQKYPLTIDNQRFLQEYGKELKIIKDKLNDCKTKSNWLSCSHCDHKSSFIWNDTKQLINILLTA